MSDLNSKKICFVGAGNMATAIIGGLVANGIDAKQIAASEPSEEKLFSIKQKYQVAVETDNQKAVSGADVVVLSVKPQVLKAVCEDLQASLKPGAMVISIAAGVELSSLQEWLGENAAIVRCMPNTPSQVQLGASALIGNHLVSDLQKRNAFELFSSVGICSWVDSEDLIHSVTALSGSGPAYGFAFISAMEQAALKQGISSNMAREFAAQTILGAAKMVLETDVSPEQLKKNVMSPGGTTEKAIGVFESMGLSEMVFDAMNAAHQRSIELAEMAKNKA